MKHIKTILVDDEPRGLASLQKLLQLNCPEVDVVACCNNAEESKDAITRLHPQLVFLDIAMPGKTGFDLLRDLEEIDFEIIFVTAHNNYMIQAFHFSAVDYLLKPVEDDLLMEAVKRAWVRINNKTGDGHIETLLYNLMQRNGTQKMKLCIPSLKGFQVVEIQDIIYCEASSNYTNFHFSNRPVLCASKPIHEYEELLGDCNFIRIHKSFMVNLEHVKEYIRGEGGSVVLSNNHEVEVSRRKKDMLMTRMKDYYKF
ncbi:MAG TPA: LytTR family DNA-binding domain-containing protein [Ferruginibacter sp.]|nr:response regulator transcription factor [Chitinophagaceae bacterium]MBP6287251.1 response regulator transcription factor [Ferruginibacter sp.]HQY11929.1 LytTR family DNA-binding domain-containing protein [Ferruginibacter sp.]